MAITKEIWLSIQYQEELSYSHKDNFQLLPCVLFIPLVMISYSWYFDQQDSPRPTGTLPDPQEAPI